MARIPLDELLELPDAERLEIAQALWDSLASNPESVPVTEAQRQELDRRLEAYAKDPDIGDTWDEVKRSLGNE